MSNDNTKRPDWLPEGFDLVFQGPSLRSFDVQPGDFIGYLRRTGNPPVFLARCDEVVQDSRGRHDGFVIGAEAWPGSRGREVSQTLHGARGLDYIVVRETAPEPIVHLPVPSCEAVACDPESPTIAGLFDADINNVTCEACLAAHEKWEAEQEAKLVAEPTTIKQLDLEWCSLHVVVGAGQGADGDTVRMVFAGLLQLDWDISWDSPHGSLRRERLRVDDIVQDATTLEMSLLCRRLDEDYDPTGSPFTLPLRKVRRLLTA